MHLRQLTATAVGALAAVALPVALASCSSDSNKPAATAPADVDLTVLAGPGIKFDQTSYTITAGEVKVAYTSRDSQRHTLDFVDDSKTVIGKELAVGKSGDTEVGTYTFEPGTYTLECLVPGHEAMRAKLTVTP
jgi:plastocyanin